MSSPEFDPIVDPKRHNRFERARIIGARALQIAMGAPILLDLDPSEVDPVRIAEIEYERGVIPVTVIRPKGRIVRKMAKVRFTASKYLRPGVS